MKRRILTLVLFALSLISGFYLSCQSSNLSTANLILKNGYIYTVDSNRTITEAIAIKDGKFIYVGSNKDIDKYISKETKVIDLGGRLVLPGFIDSHCHPAYGAAHQLFDVMLNGLKSIKEYQRAIKDFAAAHPNDKFIRGMGWTNAIFGKTGPDKKIIDEVVNDRPVLLADDGGHAKWVNSKALELAGITKDTKDPKGGVIERDPKTGEPTGTLRENASYLIKDIFPDYYIEQLEEAIKSYQKMAASFGITTAHDASVDPDGNDFNAYLNLEKENKLTIRFPASIYVDPDKGLEQVNQLIKVRAKCIGPLFKANSAKIYIDGVVEGSTAFLKEPYKHLPNFRGEPLWKTDDLNKMCAELDKNKFQIHVHSIGDAATTMILDAFDYTAKKNGKRDSRNLITHLQLVDPKDIIRFKRTWSCSCTTTILVFER